MYINCKLRARKFQPSKTRFHWASQTLLDSLRPCFFFIDTDFRNTTLNNRRALNLNFLPVVCPIMKPSFPKWD